MSKTKGKIQSTRLHASPEGVCSSTPSLTPALDGVGGQLQTPAALPSGKENLYPLLQQAEWAPSSVWKGEENLASIGQPVTSPYTGVLPKSRQQLYFVSV